MTSAAEKLFEDALSLPEEAGEGLALCILDSVPRHATAEVADAWGDEVVRRVEQVRQGKVTNESWAEVEAHLDASLRR